ncbi:MAG: protein phosphatase 2C domain-containing protein [Gracilibacteraceae bacterium]|jgi:protein phosphatase|nr:protein phosphatase 2C domain-containing protein [Gracilibacteraceae bacterium]
MEYFHFSETGSVRQNNEDDCLLLPEAGLFAVADGMGGHSAGEVASALAVDSLRRKAGELKDLAAAAWMKAAVTEANRRIFAASGQKDQAGMGTTLTACVVDGKQAVFGHIGDSRAYLFRAGVFTQLTRDHSVVEDLVRGGALTPEEALRHPARNVLSRALDGGPAAPDYFAADIYPGDALLLCTDGFSNLLAAEEISRDMREREADCLFALWKDLIFERGAPDNFTAVLFFPRGR